MKPPEPISPKVFVVVLNYDRPRDTIECVESIQKSDYTNYGIVIVDNASTNPSVVTIRKRFPDLPLLLNDKNLGYAGGNNVGIRYALERGCDYVLILNNDAIITKDTIARLVEAGERHKEATLIGPKVCRYDRPKVIDSCGTSINWFRLKPHEGAWGEEDVGQFAEVEEKEILPGSALLLKKNLFETVGFFNDLLFLIHEDADLCLRNIQKGYKNIIAPNALAYHKVSKTLSAHPFLSAYYSIRNILYLSQWHASFIDRAKSRIGLSILILKNFLKFITGTGERDKISGFFSGVRDFCGKKLGPYETKR